MAESTHIEKDGEGEAKSGPNTSISKVVVALERTRFSCDIPGKITGARQEEGELPSLPVDGGDFPNSRNFYSYTHHSLNNNNNNDSRVVNVYLFGFLQ